MTVNLQDDGFVISGHITTRPPSLDCGSWNGGSLSVMGEEELRAVLACMQLLCDEKFKG